MPSNRERIEGHTSRIEDVVNQIITAGGFVFVATPQTITGNKTFMETVGIANEDGTVDYLKHINNNFLISSSEGVNLLNIDEGLKKVYVFNKELAFKDDIIPGGGASGGTRVTVGSSEVDDLYFDSDPQTQITAISNRVKPAIVNVSHNENTGEFAFTRDNGTSFTVDTLLEKVVTNFTYNEDTQNLELKLEDGTVKYIPMTAFIDDYSGTDGDVVTVSVSNDNKISAVIKNGTITKNHLSETVQATLTEVGSNTGKIDSLINSWSSKADVSALNNKSEIQINNNHVDLLNFTSDPQTQIDNVVGTANENAGKLQYTEQVETIYDRTDSTKDWGYSGGLGFTGWSSQYQHNFSKYKRIFISGNSRGTSFTLWVDLSSPNPNEGNYQTQNVYDSVYDSALFTMNIIARLNSAKTYIEFRCRNSYTNNNSDRDAYVNKIIGWY